ncbi:MurR/RpiR family transcriptional regulator [Companilactobacillus alimentarius]|uniref:hypothetical protein n=1 Tax=Companilactobacillus alimentarius TaxID=1602 RepID=UPI0028B86EDF|nr:hypothetical protein [Companilactobacillus alimentarius]MDT6952052.1 hypothetical protein [Companilactobacillus alimentarius]
MITGNPNSKLIDYADQNITIVQNEFDVFKVSTFASQMTFEYLLNTLFAIVYSKSYKQNLIKMQSNYDKLMQNDILNNATEPKKRP